ncbi:MAG: response regulator transcription factor [Treponema sp.]|nr:response regulator transcription factor [Treponema sp.]
MEKAQSKIELVEDDLSTIEFLKPELEHEGFEVCLAQTGREALEVFEKESPSLILLDIMLPELNGLEVLRQIRKKSDLPVILVTARNETFDKVKGLNAGADDYISKPFEIEELLARVNAVLRRIEKINSAVKQETEIVNGEITLIPKAMAMNIKGNQIQLSKTEYLMLKLFMENPGELFSRDKIIDEVWGENHIIEPNAVDVYINYLRNKIKSVSEKEYFKNKRGVGFLMEKC